MYSIYIYNPIYSIMYIFISNMSSIKSMNRKKDWKKISQNFNSNNLFYHPLSDWTIKNLPAMQETWVQSLEWKMPWTREWQPTPVFLTGESHGQRSLVAVVHGGHKKSDMTGRLTHTHTHTHIHLFFRVGTEAQRNQTTRPRPWWQNWGSQLGPWLCSGLWYASLASCCDHWTKYWGLGPSLWDWLPWPGAHGLWEFSKVSRLVMIAASFANHCFRSG